MPAPAHAYWKGHIRLSLVTFPVEMYPAVSDAQKIKLHKISKGSKERVHYKDTTEGDGDVEKSDIVKGYEYDKGQYIEINDAELKKLKVESSHTIDLVQFTDLKDVDPIYFDKPYFLAPDGDIAMEAYVTLRDALHDTKKVALGQISIGGRERIAAIKACDKGLILETLRYNDEVRQAGQYFDVVDDDVKPNKEQLSLAADLIKSKSKKFDPKMFKDHYQEGLMEIIQAKLGHRKPHIAKSRAEPGNVVNIMDALKRSLAESGKTKKKPASKKPAAKKTAKKKKAA